MAYKKGSYKKGGKGRGSSKAAAAAVTGVKAQRVSIQLLQDRVRALETEIKLLIILQDSLRDEVFEMVTGGDAPPNPAP